MALRRRLRTKATLFSMLMIASAAAAFLPRSWLGWLRTPFTQVLGWGQRPLRAAEAQIERLTAPTPILSREDVLRLQSELDALRLQVGHQADLLRQREALLADLSGLRQSFPDAEARIIIGRLVAGADSDFGRETAKISIGAIAGVSRTQWVAAGLKWGETVEGRDGRPLLLHRWLIGRIDQVTPYASQVQLVTDPKFRAQVAAARVLGDGTLQVVGDEMILEGVGQGKMRIASATADHFNEGATMLLASAADGLPARMVVGRITASEQLPEAPLHWRLEAEPWGGLAQIQGVYVIAAPARRD